VRIERNRMNIVFRIVGYRIENSISVSTGEKNEMLYLKTSI